MSDRLVVSHLRCAYCGKMKPATELYGKYRSENVGGITLTRNICSECDSTIPGGQNES